MKGFLVYNKKMMKNLKNTDNGFIEQDFGALHSEGFSGLIIGGGSSNISSQEGYGG